MRRWIALFLLVLLPLLSSWIAASAYGDDGTQAQSQHIGHHLDEHQVAADAPDSAKSDCDHCHSPGVTPLAFADSAGLPAPDRPSLWIDVALRAPPLSLPERPNWVRFA